MESLKPGTILHGKRYEYNIIRSLGQGTFGITYLASVKMTGELGSLDSEIQVAVKEFFMRDFNGRNENSVTYSSEDGTFAYYRSKFIHEAEILSKLHNPGIIKVMELFEENQTAYYVMEYISSGSLDVHIKSRGRLSSKESVDYAIQIAEALGYMHQNKMLHLDLKPNNIMIRKDNRPVLIDFGLSKRFDANGKPATSIMIGHGTPGYAPTEQADYQGNQNGEFPTTMDIYALGGTMFKMLTGNRPPEASVILNEGFPAAELENIGVDKRLVEIVGRCMEPLRKNRYKTTYEIIEALSKLETLSEEDTDIPKGYFKRKTGEAEYGSYKIENVPVTTSFKFPESINIKLWDNGKLGKSYEVLMTNGQFEDGCYNLIRIWDKGVLVDEHEFQHGIPDDVKYYLICHGFLSTEHWENESQTSPLDYDFGTDASITMIQGNGEIFKRRVPHAHPSYHNLLLDDLLELIKSTSLSEQLEFEKNQRINTEKFVVPLDTYEISVSFQPSQIGLSRKIEGGFDYIISQNSVCMYNNGRVWLDPLTFHSLLGEFGELGIQTGPYKKDSQDYSEIPGTIDIKFHSREQGLLHLSLIAFHTDMQGGNIYGSHIADLAESIHRIILKYIPNHESTREFIYSIPDSTSKISIDYDTGGAVGLNQNHFHLSLANDQRLAIVDNACIYDPNEFSMLVKGLRKLNLKSQNEKNIEAPTGITFPKLTLSLYDAEGHLLKKIYAQDDGETMIGNVVISVDSLKNELAKLSKTFRDKVTIDNNKQGQSEHGSIGEVIFRFFLFSIIIAIIAVPTYLFVKPEDELFKGLWLTIGLTEFFAALLFSIGAIFNKTKRLSNFETISFIIGAVCFIAYVVLWIVQMCKWWT